MVREQREETEKRLFWSEDTAGQSLAGKSTKVPLRSHSSSTVCLEERPTCEIREESKRQMQKCLLQWNEEFGLESAGTKRLPAVKVVGKVLFAF